MTRRSVGKSNTTGSSMKAEQYYEVCMFSTTSYLITKILIVIFKSRVEIAIAVAIPARCQ